MNDDIRACAIACAKQGMRVQRASWFDIFCGPPVPVGLPEVTHGAVDPNARTLSGVKFTMRVQWKRARIAQPFTPEWLTA